MPDTIGEVSKRSHSRDGWGIVEVLKMPTALALQGLKERQPGKLTAGGAWERVGASTAATMAAAGSCAPSCPIN